MAPTRQLERLFGAFRLGLPGRAVPNADPEKVSFNPDHPKPAIASIARSTDADKPAGIANEKPINNEG